LVNIQFPIRSCGEEEEEGNNEEEGTTGNGEEEGGASIHVKCLFYNCVVNFMLPN